MGLIIATPLLHNNPNNMFKVSLLEILGKLNFKAKAQVQKFLLVIAFTSC